MRDIRPMFLECAEHLIRPAIRFCLRRSLTFQDLTPIIRKIFVQEARKELVTQNTEPSMSKLSVMTGLRRPDIAAYLEERPVTAEASVAARVVSQWSTDKRYLHKDGAPRHLELTGRNSEFAQLVARVSKELNSYAVLFDLERLNLVRREDDRLVLTQSGVVVSSDTPTAFRFLGNDLEDLVNAVEGNLVEDDDSPNLHIKAHFDNIVKEAVPEIRREVLKKGSAFIREIQQYLSQFDKDVNPELARKEGGSRIALGVFSVAKNGAGGRER